MPPGGAGDLQDLDGLLDGAAEATCDATCGTASTAPASPAASGLSSRRCARSQTSRCRARSGGSSGCEQDPSRVRSAYGSPEQAECRPRLGGVERRPRDGEAEGEVGGTRSRQRVEAPEQGRDRGRLATVGGAVWFLRRRSDRLRRELIFALCEEFVGLEFSDLAKCANFRRAGTCTSSSSSLRLPLAPSTERN